MNKSQKNYKKKIINLLQVLNKYSQENKETIIAKEFLDSILELHKEIKIN